MEVKMELISEAGMLKPGDHIVVREKDGEKFSAHHGIFVSFEEGIIHLGGIKPNVTVKQTDFLRFIQRMGDKKELWKIIYDSCSPADTVVERAQNFLKNPSMIGSYSLIENNCEHFATNCKLGTAISMQIIQKIRECYRSPVKLFKTVFHSKDSSASFSKSYCKD